MVLTNPQVKAHVRAAMQRYLGLPAREAALHLAWEVQGYVNSQIQRGVPLSQVLANLDELLRLIREAES